MFIYHFFFFCCSFNFFFTKHNNRSSRSNINPFDPPKDSLYQQIEMLLLHFLDEIDTNFRWQLFLLLNKTFFFPTKTTWFTTVQTFQRCEPKLLNLKVSRSFTWILQIRLCIGDAKASIAPKSCIAWFSNCSGSCVRFTITINAIANFVYPKRNGYVYKLKLVWTYFIRSFPRIQWQREGDCMSLLSSIWVEKSMFINKMKT